MALREDAGLLERDGRANASVFADDAEAAFGGAIVVRAAVKQHAASALGTILFWEHEVLFSDFRGKRQGMFEGFALFVQVMKRWREEVRKECGTRPTDSL